MHAKMQSHHASQTTSTTTMESLTQDLKDNLTVGNGVPESERAQDADSGAGPKKNEGKKATGAVQMSSGIRLCLIPVSKLTFFRCLN